MIINIFFCKLMSLKKVYTYEDLNDFSIELIKLINDKFKKLNADKNITYPTRQDYEELSDIASKILNVTNRCLGIYITGRNRGKRCQASPRPGSKYCLNHQSQDPDNKPDKSDENNELDPEILKEAIELLKKAKLKKQND